jgi:hypothetical protein
MNHTYIVANNHRSYSINNNLKAFHAHPNPPAASATYSCTSSTTTITTSSSSYSCSSHVCMSHGCGPRPITASACATLPFHFRWFVVSIDLILDKSVRAGVYAPRGRAVICLPARCAETHGDIWLEGICLEWDR